ncbi:MAG TPA: diguanylate cyclase [Anaerolineales bacterium]|nr:diguanylate cyclase [Anaerolineales bacterium]
MNMRRFTGIWEGLVEPARIGNPREHHLSRILNVILILILVWGLALEFQYRLSRLPFGRGEIVTLAMIATLILAYYLNRRGFLTIATILTLALFTISIFVLALFQHWSGSASLPVLYYLIIPILMGELFFSMVGYLISTALLLAGVLGFSLFNPTAGVIFVFLFIFCILIGFSSYNRRLIDEEQLSLTQRFEREQLLLSMEQRKSAQLRLLAEVGRLVTDSLNEKEILENTLDVIVQEYGYAEVAISLLVADDMLEVAAISGTQDFGYRPGYQQDMESGIIGHVAKTRTAYLTGDVSQDPYYFSSAVREGSAIGIPMLDKEVLLGVIYVESTKKNELNGDDLQTLQTLANQVATSVEKARLYARSQEHLQVMTMLQSVSHTVTSSLELEEILNNVLQSLKDSFGYTYASIYLFDGDVLHMGAQLGYPEDMLIREIAINEGVIGRTARSRETQFVRDVNLDSDFMRASYDVRSEIAVPLLKEDNVLGVLNVESGHDLLTENDVNLLKALAGSVAIAIDNARLHAEVKRMAMTDVISGLANRRAFDEILEVELMRASRYQHSLSLIILDLDSFKEYNDKWGHPAGDVRLREVANLLRLNVREPDVAARYGGEEFAIILPDTSKHGAMQLAERLRHSAAGSAPERSEDSSPVPGYTLSLGVATFPDDAASIEELLLMADNAELMAKRLGKNRVYAANSSDKIQNP